jgi:predicted RNase H-like HicB family nuclease
MNAEPRYEIIIYWSDEDRAFIAEVPELPGCAADGPTYEAAVANVKTVIAEWIEMAQEMGRDIPEPRGRLILRVVLRGSAATLRDLLR